MAELDKRILNTKETLVNFSCSILNHFGVIPPHPTIESIDKVLNGHNKIAVFLFDGLGKYPLELHKDKAQFILEHAYTTLLAVNPPTTAASTTALLSASFPIENGWIGWAPYQHELGYPVELFSAKNYFTKEKINNWSMYKKCPIKTIDQTLEENGVKAAKKMYIPKKEEALDINIMKDEASSFFKEGGNFLYSYWVEPDASMHKKGVGSSKVASIVEEINTMVTSFVKENPDVLLFTIADHGLINVEQIDIAPYKEITSTFLFPMANEGRCLTFFIKEGYHKQFEEAFKKAFPSFYLMSKEEALEKNFFGEGTTNPIALEEMGDYIGVATDNKLLYNSLLEQDHHMYLAHHAGGTLEEKEILVGLFNR